MERAIRFPSGDLELSGVLHLPETTRDGQLPCFVVIHGFGSNKDATNVQGPVKMLNEWGYAAFRFDMRGCGQSDGSFGRVICLEQVADTRAAIDLLQAQPELDPQRIGVLGSSFGAAVAIYAAGVDDRIAAVVSSGGWGHGERKFRRQHPTQEGWLRFTEMLERGSLHREQTGESLMVDNAVPSRGRSVDVQLLRRRCGWRHFPSTVTLAAFVKGLDHANGAVGRTL
jgi:alpha/beta superfamily hydrolase